MLIMGRSKCMRSTASKKVISYNEFNNRLRKTFYYGSSKLCGEEMEISRPLAEYASDIFSEPHKGHSLNRLSSITAGSVHATPCSLIMALIYLDRLNMTDPCYARRISPQELFIVSMMISTKFYAGHDEDIYLNEWADDGNITEKRLKELELEFLCAIEWNVYISSEQFFSKLQVVEKTIARREGLKRGWLTYTELVQMLPSFTFAKFVLNNVSLLAMGYAASVMTLAGAFFLATQLSTQASKTNTVTSVTLPENSTETMSCTSTTCGNIQTVMNETAEDKIEVPTSFSITSVPFNIEAELLKLENEYNGLNVDSLRALPTSPFSYLSNSEKRFSCKNIKSNRKALSALQEEYSKRFNYSNFVAETIDELNRSEEPICRFGSWPDCVGSIIWHLLRDLGQGSFVRAPMFWYYKFI